MQRSARTGPEPGPGRGPGPAPGRVPGAFPESVRALTRLVVPVACPGCGQPDVVCCPACADLLAGGARRVERTASRLDRLDGVAPLPVWALAPYSGAVRELVLAWKDRGRVDADRVLGPAVRGAARAVAPALAAVAGARAGGESGAGPGPVLVVPAPSTAAARRARGRDHLAGIARQVAGGLADAGLPARVAPALRRRRRGRDQVGLGARERGRNLAAAVVVRPRALRPVHPRGPVCLLVDDVVTTGATLAAAEQALEAAGARPAGALVVAATPPPGRDGPFATRGTVPVYRADEVGLAWGSDGGFGATASTRPTHERAGP